MAIKELLPKNWDEVHEEFITDKKEFQTLNQQLGFTNSCREGIKSFVRKLEIKQEAYIYKLCLSLAISKRLDLDKSLPKKTNTFHSSTIQDEVFTSLINSIYPSNTNRKKLYEALIESGFKYLESIKIDNEKELLNFLKSFTN